jgi:hypothetical protein
MLAEFITPEDTRWSQLLEQARHDFYHLPEYVAFVSRHENQTPLAFYAETNQARFLAPLWVRELPRTLDASDDWYDAITPAGFTTPVLFPADDSASLARFLMAFREVGAARGIITTFFRLHPLFPLPHAGLTACGDLKPHGEMVTVDLSLPLEEQWTQTCRNHRQNIRQLLRRGFYAEMDRWEYFEDFIDIYTQNMTRCRALDYYFFSNGFFSDLRAVLGDRVHLCTVFSPPGELASAGLFIDIKGFITAHLAGTGDKFVPYAPAKLMFDYARRWAKEQGAQLLNLGGGVTCTADSLFEFKAGFSKDLHRYHTFRMVLDEEKYETLNQRWREKVGKSYEESDFFPIYRRPLVPVAEPESGQTANHEG